MTRRVIKKIGAVLIASGLSIGMCSPSVSANVKTNINTNINIKQITQKKTARYIEPEEWNKEELTAYQFDSEVDMMKYLVSGGMHLYNKNYKGQDRWVKIKVADPGLFMVGIVSNDEKKIPLYDAAKKRIIANNLNDGGDEEYVGIVKTGDEFYVKLPEKIDKVIILTGVIKTEFTSMANKKSYYELGKGTTTYHPFSVPKRSKVQFEITSIGKKHEKVGVYIEKNVNGTWKKIGYSTTVKPDKYDSALLYGLEAGQYRLALKTPKEQIINVEYTRDKSKKKAAYKKSKAINIKSDIDSIYTSTEKAARWYKVSVTSTKKGKAVTLSKDSAGGGFKLRVYQKGKLLKTVKITKNEKVKTIKLPKKKGTYYVKITKLTSKTTGAYYLGTYTY